MPSEAGFGGFRRFHTAGMRLHQNTIPPAFPICRHRFLQNKPPAPLLQKAVRHSEYPEPRYKMTFQTAFAPPRRKQKHYEPSLTLPPGHRHIARRRRLVRHRVPYRKKLAAGRVSRCRYILCDFRLFDDGDPPSRNVRGGGGVSSSRHFISAASSGFCPHFSPYWR